MRRRLLRIVAVKFQCDREVTFSSACRMFLVLTPCLLLLEYFGAFDHLVEIPYSYFQYPPDGVDLRQLVDLVKMGRMPGQGVVNEWNVYPVVLLGDDATAGVSGCSRDDDVIDLLILVKSAVVNFEARDALRRAWAQDRRVLWQGRTWHVKHYFFLGLAADMQAQARVLQEARSFGDVIQHSFLDVYYNNTLKTVTALKWAAERCPQAGFLLFVDDDYYVSLARVFQYIRALSDAQRKRLYAGFRFFTHVLRHRSSAFYMPLREYPFSHYPPYITAGAYLMSNFSALDFYIGSRFVKLFRFDDVYLGILAQKLGIDPQHSDEFIFWEQPYQPGRFHAVIAAHGFKNPVLLQRAAAQAEQVLLSEQT